MNSRERVCTAMSHREPDRPPIDFGGHRSSGIAAMAYARLRDHLGFEKRPIRIYDPIQQLAVIDEDVLDRFQVDTIELGRGFALGDADWVDWPLPDGTPGQMPAWAAPERVEDRWVLRNKSGLELGRMPDGAIYFEQTNFPLLGKESLTDEDFTRAFDECIWAAVASPPFHLDDPDHTQLAEGARKLRESTDRAIIGLFGGNLLELGQMFFRMDQFLMMLRSNPDLVNDFLDRMVRHHLKNLEWFLGAVGPHIDVIVFGDDLGMQGGPQMATDMYMEYFQPREKLMWRRAKELAPNVKINLHSCGGIRPLYPGLIDAGLDCHNPVQTSCTGMEPEGMKRDFGRDMVLWGGGCDTRDVLGNATPEGIRQHVKERLGLLAPGGGFVFQQVHNILANVPPENIVAMFDAVIEYGE